MSNEINFHDSMKKISEYLQTQKAAEQKEQEKTIADVDIESIFAEFKGNGIEDVTTEQFALAFAEDYLEKEIKDTKSLDSSYIDAWGDVAAFDAEDDYISFEEAQEVLDAFKESQLPDGWEVDNGVVKTPDKKEVEARPSLDEGHKVENGKIVDENGKEVGVVAEIEKDTDGDGVADTVESYYYYKTEDETGKPDPANGEKAVAKDDLPDGYTITDDGKILDKDKNEIGRTEVTYADGTGDGVNDKITSYYLYNSEPAEDETKLPDDWTENEDGTITDDEGNTLGGKAVQAEDLEAMGYDISDDGFIYDANGNKVGRNISSETDVDGDGVADVAQSCYLYADTEATKPEGFPENWTINKDGTVTDENGNVLGGVADDAAALENAGYVISDDGYIYPPGADTSDPANAVGRSYSYETTDADGNPVTAQACYFDAAYEAQNPNLLLPEGLTKDQDGKIKDEDGRELSVVEPDDKSLEGLTEKDGEYYNEFGQKVAITGDDGTIYMYNEVPELEPVAKTKDEALPADKNYEIDDQGNIIDKDTGFKVGYVDVEYADATGDGVNDKITSYYIYEEKNVDNSSKPSTTDENPDDPVPSTETPATETPSTETPATETPATETPATDKPVSETPEDELPVLQSPPEDNEKSVLTDEAAAQFAKQLYDSTAGRMGTDKGTFMNILENPELTADDWVKIISSYNESYGSFIQDVDADFSMGTQDDLMVAISSKLLEAAEGGNQDAINLLAKEIYNGTAGMTGTANEFIDAFMNHASDEVLMAVMQSYSSVNDGANIYDDIKADFSGKAEDAYIARLNEILAKMRE